MSAVRVLTFNFHEPYLCLMAKTGLSITVGLYRDAPLARPWQTQFRPVPSNVSFLDEPDWRRGLEAGAFDVVVAQNETNAADLAGGAIRSKTPLILVCHNRRTFLETTIAKGGKKDEAAYDELLERIREHFGFVFISKSKQEDYGIPGTIIPPGIDVEEYGGYTGERAEVLRVGNMMRARDLMFDVGFQEQVCEGFPNRVAGVDPDIPGAVPSESFEDLLDIYRSSRCLLHVTREAYEDGYNLSTLEAMACGMPVVSLANPTSPLTDGVDGFISYDAGTLRERIEQLLGDLDLAREIGARGRETVASQFPVSAFVDRWREILESAAENSPRSTQGLEEGDGFSGESRFRTGGYYCAPRPELADHVPRHAERILDCGCGGGEFGRSLKLRGAKEVVGIEIVERAYDMAQQVLDDVILGDIEEIDLPFDDGHFDCIVCGDVLEHLVDPMAVLAKLSRVLAPDGVMVVCIPNVRFWQVIDMLVDKNRWKYENAGILDSTHLRFFAAVDMQKLVLDAGLAVLKMQPIAMHSSDQLPRNADGSISIGRVTIDNVTDAEYDDLLTYQYVIIAGKADADRLARARRAFDEQDFETAYHCAEQATGADEFERIHVMAKAIARLGKLDMAENLYREALALRPDDSAVGGELGMVLIAMNRTAEAKPLLERAVEADPGNDRAIGATALMHMAEGDHAEAFDHFQRALEISFDNDTLILPFIQTAHAATRLEDAEDMVRRLADYYPGNLPVQCAFADMLHQLGKSSDACKRLEAVLLLTPGHAEAQALLDRIRQDQP